MGSGHSSHAHKLQGIRHASLLLILPSSSLKTKGLGIKYFIIFIYRITVDENVSRHDGIFLIYKPALYHEKEEGMLRELMFRLDKSFSPSMSSYEVHIRLSSEVLHRHPFSMPEPVHQLSAFCNGKK